MLWAMLLLNLKIKLHEACSVIKKEILIKVFFKELCEITNNNFFTEYLWWLLLPVTEIYKKFPKLQFLRYLRAHSWE